MGVVPDRYFRKSSPFIQQINKQLWWPGHHKIKVIESVVATLTTEKDSPRQDLYIVENFEELLLEETSIKTQKQPKAVYTVKIEG